MKPNRIPASVVFFASASAMAADRRTIAALGIDTESAAAGGSDR